MYTPWAPDTMLAFLACIIHCFWLIPLSYYTGLGYVLFHPDLFSLARRGDFYKLRWKPFSTVCKTVRINNLSIRTSRRRHRACRSTSRLPGEEKVRFETVSATAGSGSPLAGRRHTRWALRHEAGIEGDGKKKTIFEGLSVQGRRDRLDKLVGGQRRVCVIVQGVAGVTWGWKLRSDVLEGACP